MLSQEILSKIKHIEIYTRRILNNTLAGDSRSAIKGAGFEFDQIREYQMGDDVRYIDWKSSVRMNTLLTKQYIEERSRTVIIAVDCSGSAFFSSDQDLRYDTIARLASVLTLVADYGKDHVGLIMFSSNVELFIPPKRGRMHTHMIMERLFDYKPAKTGTDLNNALEYLVRRTVAKSLVFMISDFIAPTSFTKYLGIAAKKHDMVAIRCLDAHEKQFPAVGFIPIQDSETGEYSLLDTRGRNRDRLNKLLAERITEQNHIFKQHGVDVLDVRLDQSFMHDLIYFFRRRMMY